MKTQIRPEIVDERKTRSNPLMDKSYVFALKTLKFSMSLQNEHKEYIISKQVLRSGTAVGALSEEAQQAESKADFIHKLAIANKEAHETHYWLRLLRDTEELHLPNTPSLISDCEELMRLLISIIKKSKANRI